MSQLKMKVYTELTSLALEWRDNVLNLQAEAHFFVACYMRFVLQVANITQ